MSSQLVSFCFLLLSFLIVGCGGAHNQGDEISDTFFLGQEIADSYDRYPDRPDGSNSLLAGLSYRNPDSSEITTGLIRKAVHKYLQSSDKEKADMRLQFSDRQHYLLMSFCDGLVIDGVNAKDTSMVRDGMLALSLIDERVADYRDVYISFGVVGYGLHYLGMSREDELKLFKLHADKATSEIATNSLSGEYEDNPIEDFSGYTAVDLGDGIELVSVGFDAPASSKDLIILIRKIEKFVKEESTYPLAYSTVSTKIPPVWFGENKELAKPILNKAIGTASIHADEAPVNDRMTGQMFLLFLAEFENYRDAEDLKDLIDDIDGGKDYKGFALTSNNRFLILIARCTNYGEPDKESDESIERFRAPLQDLLNQD